MRIERLVLEQVGCFDHLEIDFKPGRDPRKADIHLLVEPNGSGKTTILLAMAQVFSLLGTGVEKRFRNAHSYALLKLEPYGVAAVAPRRYPSSLAYLGAEMAKSQVHEDLTFFESREKKEPFFLAERRNLWADFSPFSAAHQETRFSHVAFAYGGQRSVESFGLKGIVEQDDAPLAAACITPKPVQKDQVQPFIQWIANTSAKAALARERNDARGAARYRDAIGRIEDIISRITGRTFAFLLSYEPINVSVLMDGEEVAVDVLPDGLKSLVSWIGDLLMRMDRVPWVDDTPLLEREITLFLDEIEVHLHPAWQRKVLPVVQDLFPNAQVFVSTHSPFIIASADDAWIYPLYLDEQGRGQVGETLPSMLGNSYATVLRDVLGIEAEFAPQVDERLKAFYESRDRALRQEPGALEAMRAKAQELGSLSEEVLAIVRPEVRQVERRLAERAAGAGV